MRPFKTPGAARRASALRTHHPAAIEYIDPDGNTRWLALGASDGHVTPIYDADDKCVGTLQTGIDWRTPRWSE